MVKTEKLDGKVVDVRLTSITIIDMDTRAHVVVPNKSIADKAITNVIRATNANVREKFTILLNDQDKAYDIIRSFDIEVNKPLRSKVNEGQMDMGLKVPDKLVSFS
ncbi:hypothetical protein QYF36_025099 [Acer negundo]|nr:hypothetical protein QYF36_025099 [Acer negundo]